MKYIDTGTRLADVERFLDEQQTKYAQKVYAKTGYPVGHEMREIVKSLINGEWELDGGRGYYDILNIPYKDGVLVIRRPMMNLDDCSYRGHQVSFTGRITSDLEELVKIFLSKLHQIERAKSKEWFIRFNSVPYLYGEGIPTSAYLLPKEEVQELAKLFDS